MSIAGQPSSKYVSGRLSGLFKNDYSHEKHEKWHDLYLHRRNICYYCFRPHYLSSNWPGGSNNWNRLWTTPRLAPRFCNGPTWPGWWRRLQYRAARSAPWRNCSFLLPSQRKPHWERKCSQTWGTNSFDHTTKKPKSCARIIRTIIEKPLLTSININTKTKSFSWILHLQNWCLF